MATIYYLNWDKENNKEQKEFFHDMHTTNNNLSLVNKDWYRKIGRIKSENKENIWLVCQRDFPVKHDSELMGMRNTFLNFKERSMSVGDIIQIDNKLYIAISIGFKEVNWS